MTDEKIKGRLFILVTPNGIERISATGVGWSHHGGTELFRHLRPELEALDRAAKHLTSPHPAGDHAGAPQGSRGAA